MPLNLRKLSVLVVEDNPHMRQLLVSILKAMEVGTIDHVDSGQKALKILASKIPDIIITDWVMAQMDGLELTAKIRVNKNNDIRLIPIILMTGYTSHFRVTQARDNGITEFLAKPFTAKDLATRIAHIVNKPRDFVIAPKFTGPDRRRKTTDYKGTSRRKRKKQ